MLRALFAAACLLVGTAAQAQPDAGSRSPSWALPEGPLRVTLRGSRAELRPQGINELNRARRAEMLRLLGEGPLGGSLAELLRRTLATHREHGAYILEGGSLGPVAVGEPNSVALAERPSSGTAVGYVHTHPTPCELLAPPSADDAEAFSYEELPSQLVLECGRIWAVLAPRHAALLGRLEEGRFEGLAPGDPAAERAYLIVDDGQLRMEAYLEEERRERERRERLRERYYPRRDAGAPPAQP